MLIKKVSIIIIMLTMVTSINAQEFQGIATYKSHRKVDLKMDDKKINSDIQKSIQAQLHKQFQREYTLKFNKSESIYNQ